MTAEDTTESLFDLLPGLDPYDLRELLDVPFTDEQLAAASAPLEPGVIVAGAGSGKTSVMAARVVWLVATGQVAPERVLGLTFTTKAAAELAGRIRMALDAAGVPGGGAVRRRRPGSAGWWTEVGGADDDSADEPGEPTVSTYHAFAGRIVTEHALRLGLEPRARLLADATRFQLAGRVLRSYRGRVEALTGPLSDLVGRLVALEAEMSEHLVGPAQVVAFTDDQIAELRVAIEAARAEPRTKTLVKDLRKLLAVARQRRELAGFVDAYRAAKRDLDALDFGDQVTFAARLAETVPPVGVAERERAGVVLLDEYQDTSVAQRRLLAGLFGGGHAVTAVGDPCQAIYGWRGASVANLDGFPEHFRRADGSPSGIYQLSVNQRSGGRLLQLANDVAAKLRARHRVVELRPRPAVVDAGDTVVALHLTWPDEVRWVAERLSGIIASGRTTPGGCAVLVRARADVPALYAALLAQGVPVEVVGLGGLLSLPEVADVVATLEVLDDPTANPATLRLLTGPRVRLGVRDLAALGRQARDRIREGRGRVAGLDPPAGTPEGAGSGVAGAGVGRPGPVEGVGPDPLEESVAGIDPCDVIALADVLDEPGPALSAEGQARVRRLGRELRYLRSHAGEPLLDLVHRIVETSGLEVELAASPEAVESRRRETLASFLDVAAGFADLDGENSLSSFLAFLRAAAAHERGLDASTPSGSDAVQLMTVHKSKGLEWDVVAVPNLTRKVFPVTTVRSKWTTRPEVLPTPLRGDVAELPALGGLTREGLAAFDEDGRDYLEREERRLAYVAFTRARWLLLGSGHWWGETQKDPRGPSPFLEELRDHAAAGRGEVERWAQNPALAAGADLTWPTPYEPDALARRRAAAAAVRRHLAALADADARAGGAADRRFDDVFGDVFDDEPEADEPEADEPEADEPEADEAPFDERFSQASPADGSADGDVAVNPVPVSRAPVDGLPVDEFAGMTRDERALLAALDRDAELLVAEARRDRRPVRDVELPRSLTASQVVRLRSDPEGLARDLARPLPRRPVAQARRGTRFHAWVEEVFERRPLLDPEDIPGAEDDLFGGLPFDPVPDASGDVDLEALKEAFLASPYGNRPAVAVEAPFELLLGGRAVRGRIDAVYDLGDGRYEVVDWKTGRESADGVQLAVYRLAWARLRGIEPDRVDACFLYVRTGEVARPPLLDEAGLTALLTGQ
ncbi:MAG: ATP-dependent helicase [Frankia sp.]